MAIIVERVAPGSLAEKSGLQAGDRLVEYAGHPLASPAALKALEKTRSARRPCGLWWSATGNAWKS